MLNRRKFLAGGTAGLFAAATGIPGLNHAFAKTSDEETSKVIPVENYIDTNLSTGSKEPVGIAWVIGIDISSSIKAPEYRAQLKALANAIERDDFRESIFQHGGPGSAALFIFDFDHMSKLQIRGIDFRENDPAKFRHVANMIRRIYRRNNGGTSHHAALQNAMLCFDRMPWACERKHVNIITDGTGNFKKNRQYRKLLAERHGAIISSLTTRVSHTDVYEWCRENLTTPPRTYRHNGRFVDGGITVDVATEFETQGNDIGRYKDQVFLAFRKQILQQTASWNVTPETRHAATKLPIDPDRRRLWTAPSKLTL